MPFSNIPKDLFRGREEELGYLKGISGGVGISGNFILSGRRGIGKTALLHRLHHDLFNDTDGPVPFYYCFQSPSLKGSAFAKDFFTRLVRQVLACYRRDASIAVNFTLPLGKVLYSTTDPKLAFLHELVEDFEALSDEADFHAVIRAAFSAPATVSERLGRRIAVMLDDFHLADGLYEERPGDTPFASSALGEFSRSGPCIISRPSADGADVRAAGILALQGLTEDSAFELFGDDCSRLGVRVPDAVKELMRYTGGSPRYIRNIAAAFHRMRRSEATHENFRECYAHEAAEGDTASYISQGLNPRGGGRLLVRPALELLMRLVETQGSPSDPQRLARAFSMAEDRFEAVIEGLVKAGFVRAGAAVSVADDSVLQDSVRARYMLEVEGRASEIVREDIIRRRFGPEGESPMRFEVVIPSDVAEAELVAAKAVRQVAENANMGPDEADRLQLAVIEACINAMEHSGSHEKKVFLTCTVKGGRIEVSVESQGGKAFELGGQAEEQEDGAPPRMRGYGLKLIGGYTDGLKVERAGSRARLVLLKNIASGKEKQ